MQFYFFTKQFYFLWGVIDRFATTQRKAGVGGGGGGGVGNKTRKNHYTYLYSVVALFPEYHRQPALRTQYHCFLHMFSPPLTVCHRRQPSNIGLLFL